jgi:hypothetical protein
VVRVKARPKRAAAKAGPSNAGLTRTADNGWFQVGGAGRCALCEKDGDECAINLAGIEKWRASFQAGRRYRKAPPQTSCKRCLEKKKGCDLPATQEMRDALPGGGKDVLPGGGSEAAPSLAATASSGRKRRREVEVEIPTLRRTKRARPGTPVMTEGEFRKELLTVLKGIEGHLGRLVVVGEKLGSEMEKGKGKEKAIEVSDDEEVEEVDIEDRGSYAGTSGRTEDGDEEEEEDGVAKEVVGGT